MLAMIDTADSMKFSNLIDFGEVTCIQKIKDVVDGLNSVMQASSINFVLDLSAACHAPLVLMADADTGDVITHYPTQAILAIAHQMAQLHQPQISHMPHL